MMALLHLVLMSKEKADELGLKPIAKILSYADAEQAPEWFTTTPVIRRTESSCQSRIENGRYFLLGIE